MKRILYTLLLTLFLLMPAMTVTAEDVTLTLDEEKLRELIKEVIRENPELLYETINAYVVELRQKKQDQDLESSLKGPRAEDEIRSHNPVKGPLKEEDAVITIVEYTDFECPYCVRASRTMEELLKKYPENIRLVFKNKPLEMHENAMPAAKAALAAGNQGKFWEYHDRLFDASPKLGQDQLVEIAKDLKLDMERFNRDLISEEIEAQVALDIADAEALGFKGTPSFLINGIKTSGARPLAYFSEIVDRLLAEAEEKSAE